MDFNPYGIRHLEGAEQAVHSLQQGDRLMLVHEDTNPYDVLALRLERNGAALGYCPRYVNNDFHKLKELTNNGLVVSVERINLEPVTIQFRLLCQLSCDWPPNFRAFDYPEYKPITTSLQDVSKESAPFSA